MNRAIRIRDIVRWRRIEHLAHITLIENLPSIFEHGLLSRRAILHRGIDALGTDPDRRDGETDSICVTITRFQERYLQVIRRRYPSDTWAILIVRPDVLWENECLFCDKNASSNYIINTLRNLRTSHALETMFDDYETIKMVDGKATHTSFRHSNEIPSSVPTDPQAEVLVKGSIPADYIEQVCIEDLSSKDWIESILKEHSLFGTIEVLVSSFDSLICADAFQETRFD